MSLGAGLAVRLTLGNLTSAPKGKLKSTSRFIFCQTPPVSQVGSLGSVLLTPGGREEGGQLVVPLVPKLKPERYF